MPEARRGWNTSLLWRSEEHTSELQSLRHLVCRLLLEKKKKGDRLVKDLRVVEIGRATVVTRVTYTTLARAHMHSSCNVVMEILNFFFFNDTATTEIYTLSLHDALPISW